MKRLFLILIIFIFSFIAVPFSQASSASLSLSPLTGVYTIGDTFSVIVKVNSEGQAINAVEATLNFDPKNISVVNISKNGSIFSLWTTEPTFSNSAGTITFGGGTSKTFNGSAGKIIKINFKTKSVGIAKVNFLTGLVLAADFKGTNILTAMNSGIYTVQSKITIPEYIPPVNTPTAPIISSPTHPDSEKWYSNDNPEFIWKIKEDIIGTRLLVDHKSITIPTIFHSDPISEKKFSNLSDGIWYLHVQLRNEFGCGEISHFKFKIDATPPNPFEIKIKEGEETTNPQPTLLFKANDSCSQIDHYEIRIDNKEPIKVQESEYKLLPQDLGKHTIIIKAVDKAGNYTLAIKEVNVLPIEAPTITDYPKTLLPGSVLSIKGDALPEVIINIHIQKDGEEIKIGQAKSNKEGKWGYNEIDPVKKGTYEIWADNVDFLGAKSNPSEKITILVSPPIFIRIGKLAIDYLETITTLSLLILAIFFLIILGWKKILKKKKTIKKEITETEIALYKAFRELEKEIKEEVAKLDGKSDLSSREKEAYDKLNKTLEISKNSIKKEVKDIEEELK